jgi:hypothetical protein
MALKKRLQERMQQLLLDNMPYIKYERRQDLDIHLESLAQELLNKKETIAGDLNYTVSFIINRIIQDKLNYDTANCIIGVLDCIKQEFYRRVVSNYEDQKINENGDVYRL